MIEKNSGCPPISSAFRVALQGAWMQGPEPFGHTMLPLASGHLTALYGRNGAGKSRVLAGLDATARTVRPPRRDRCSGSLVFSLVEVPDALPGRGYTVSAVPWFAERLQDLAQRLSTRVSDAEQVELPELLSEVARAALRVDSSNAGPAPSESSAGRIELVAAMVRDDPHVALTVPFAGDAIDPGDLRPVLALPAVPFAAAEVLDTLDLSDPGVNAAQVQLLQKGFEGVPGEEVLPVPLWPPEAEPLALGGHGLEVLPPVIRLYEDDVVAPTLAVLYGVPTLREHIDPNPRPLIDIACDEEFRLIDEVASAACSLQHQTNMLYGRLLEDAPTLRLRIRHPNSWARVSAVAWLAEATGAVGPADLPAPGDDDLPGRWVGVADLSTAQQRWARFAIRVACLIADPVDASSGAIAIMDEPEQALHRQAERFCAEGLRAVARELDLALVVATHSPEVLDAPDARPLHVTRGADGSSAVRAFAGWGNEDPATFGLNASDLMLRYRVFLAVEGRQDQAALEGWLGQEFEESRTAILPLGGSHELPALATSRLLLDMTDAHVVVLLDAVDPVPLTKQWAEIRSGWENGGDARARAGERLNALGSCSEEAGKLRDLLRQALRGGHGDRVHPNGLSAPDIHRYIPPRLFQEGESNEWNALVNIAHRGVSPPVTSEKIKRWLRVHRGINITSQTIRDAAHRQAQEGEIPAEIMYVIAACRAAAQSRVGSLK